MTDEDILRSLPARRQRFIVEFAKDENATAAAVRAGYSRDTAQQEGARLLRDAVVGRLARERVARIRAQVTERIEVKLERLLLEALRIATVDPATAYNASGNLLPIHQMPEDTRRAISGIETVVRNVTAGDRMRDTVLKIRWADKLKGLELAGKMSGVYVERREVGKPGAFRTLSDAELREKAAEAARALGLHVADPDRVM